MLKDASEALIIVGGHNSRRICWYHVSSDVDTFEGDAAVAEDAADEASAGAISTSFTISFVRGMAMTDGQFTRRTADSTITVGYGLYVV